MKNKRLTLFFAAIFALATIVLVSREIGHRLDIARQEIEINSMVMQLTLLVNEYTATYHETGNWPEPGTFYDDSMLNFIGSEDLGDQRIDKYETFNAYRQIDVHLEPNGNIRAYTHYPR